jgi:hypothetical protein
MSDPIDTVLDEEGNVLHDCREAGCEVSWDGYSFATGERLEGAADPGEEWDTSRPGVARRKPASD